jgi:hypothetical protein
VLKVERKEVLTHSAFLANLLNPTGSHGQGPLFLNSFLRYINFATDKIDGPWSLETEKRADCRGMDTDTDENLGRMDIVLEHPQGIVVIENKIANIDQPNQLWRYGKWLENKSSSTWPKNKSSFRLIYLTPYGKRPSEDSINPYGRAYHNKSFSLDYREDVQCLSYKKDICLWLKNCESRITASNLKTIISQYFQTIRRL